MAKFEFKLPDIGEGVSEGEIVGWLVKVGDKLAENQDMVEVMTDKATVTIGAPKAGTVAELRGAVGDTVPVGNVIIVLETGPAGGESVPVAPSDPVPPTSLGASKASAPAPASEDNGPVASAVGDLRSNLPGVDLAQGNVPAKAPVYSEQPLAAPATRKLARELGIRSQASGAHGQGWTRDS
ncbi:MAG: hypothetical protein QM784_35265 [Polyangiaceae bacterium]